MTRTLTTLRRYAWLLVLATAFACGDGGGGSSSPDAGADAGEESSDASCVAGSLGCGCSAGKRCGVLKDGTRLVCAADLCQAPGCTPGESGCACKLGTDCNGSALSCENGVCVSADCERGALDCPCLNGSCDQGLACTADAICKDAAGREGGPCLDNGACLAGARCDADADLCVFCDLGSEGCQCDDDERCSEGLGCAAGLCVQRDQLPPKNPKCYTPCLASLRSQNGSLACDDDGLLAGCIADQECSGGSCVTPGEDPPGCTGDMECPFFQACLQGNCYSNCEVNADCPAGLGCFYKVCRVPCSAELGGAACPVGTSCVTRDGSNGFCSPAGELPDTTPTAAVQTGVLSVDEERIALSNLAPARGFVLTNSAAEPIDVVVHKLAHTVYFANGTSQRVEAPRDTKSGAFVDCNAATGECPLDWLELGVGDGKKSRDRKLDLGIPASCAAADTCPTIAIAKASGGPGVRWEGELLVESPIGNLSVYLTYVQTVEGRWSGTQYYFGSFADQGLAAWAASAQKSDSQNVKNGLIQAWSAFRRGSLENWDEMLAVVTATTTESWKFDRVRSLCSNVSGGLASAVCYPHDNPSGVRIYVQDSAEFPVPSAVTELPFAINVKRDPAAANRYTGVIDSSVALQYAGRPALALGFEADPASARGGCDPTIASDCVVFARELQADVSVGGRYVPTSGTCDTGFTPVVQPWLLSDFTRGTSSDPSVGRVRSECRDTRTPYAASVKGATALNAVAAASNPAPDGVSRTRQLRLIDGGLINQSELFLLFQETFPSFLPSDAGGDTAKSTAYGMIVLRREGRALAEADYSAITPAAATSPRTPLAPVCSASLLSDLGTSDPSTVVRRLLDGTTGTAGYTLVGAATPGVFAHYLCEETGVFDNGKTTGASDPGLGCPTGSNVTYFLANVASLSAEQCQEDAKCDVQLGAVSGGNGSGTEVGSVANNGLVAKCKSVGTCKATLSNWIAANAVVLEQDPVWSCASGSYCDSNRFDLRQGKQFFRRASNAATAPIAAVQTTIDQAFRYKTRFQTVSGDAVGFAPQVCQGGSNQAPYCYDPAEIEATRERMDCLLSLYSTRIGEITDATLRGRLETFLRQSFSRFDTRRDGFERLYAELLTMLGDDAVAASFASRFDLAASSGAAFFGSDLEPNGLDLSGTLGFEMVKLYQGVQYYQLALDRLYGQGTSFAAALSRGATSNNANFISPETVTLYLERLGGASAKKARAWGEVAKRYLALNRPDLARAVVEREYTRTYLEGALLAKLMGRIVELSRSADKDQLRLVLEQSQRGYRMALLGMSDVYASIDDGSGNFGFAADYIPFPALDSGNVGDTNAYEVLAQLAQRKIDVATLREDTALANARTGRTDAATFQAELVRIRNTYEDQLADVCGTFTDEGGRVVPAIAKYAASTEATRLMGDPCGRMGNGQLYDAFLQVEDARLGVQAANARLRGIFSEIEIERERVSAQCALNQEVADFEYEKGQTKATANAAIGEAQYTMGVVQRTMDTVVQGATAAAGCDGTVGKCVAAGIATGVIVGALTAQNATASVLEKQVLDKQKELAQLDLTNAKWITQTQCDAAIIDSNARTKGLVTQLTQSQVELLRATLQTTQAAAGVQRLLNQGKRLQGLQLEAEQMLINTEAARNDPNVRIYRNDAIINADLAFDDALRTAYRATRVFEYYTSQSYAKREQLYLIRMASAGQYNLQNYMTELQNAFFDFEETYGVPSTRVAVLSLRDDVLKIPQLDGNGKPYTRDQRVAQMVARLKDPALVDQHGYLTVPFSIDFDRLSPVTRVHKIRYVEADVVGSDVGDTLGRVYLRQRGTGSLLGLDGRVQRYVFPERMGVVNAFFNGSRIYGPEVYRNGRLRDRPVANSLYELVFNLRDESVNADINIDSLTDVRLLVYYDDFTEL
jgi:hypothetical protein